VSLILKHKSLAVVEIHDGVSELRILRRSVEQHEFSAHAKVRDERSTVGEIEQDMFATTMDEIEARASELRREPLGIRIGCEARAKQLRRRNLAVRDKLVQRPCNDLNFGKLRHNR